MGLSPTAATSPHLGGSMESWSSCSTQREPGGRGRSGCRPALHTGRTQPPAAITTGTRKAPGSPTRPQDGLIRHSANPLSSTIPITAVPRGWMTAGREPRRASQPQDAHSIQRGKGGPFLTTISAQSPLEQLSPHLRHQHEPHGPCERVATLPEPGGSTEPRTKKHPTSGCRAQSHHRPVKTSAPQQVKRSPRTTARASPHRRCSYSKAG